MYGLILKKSFFNYTDNFSLSLVFNCITLILWAGILYIINMLAGGYIYPLIVFILVQYFLNGVFLVRFSKTDFSFRIFKKLIKASFLNAIIISAGVFAVNFYLFNNNILINFAGLISAWILLSYLTGSIFSLPILIKEEKFFTKSFLMFFNNFKHTVFGALLFLIFFISTVILVFGTSFGLILLKNLEEILTLKDKCGNVEEWEKILKEEADKLDGRKVKDLLFPWQK